MKKSILCVLFCLMVCLLMSACAPIKQPSEPYGIMQPTQALLDGLKLLKPYEATKSSSKSSQERYAIVIDDGIGMKGFIAQNCFTYRAALLAAMDVSIGGESSCYTASELTGTSKYTSLQSDKFFNNAMQDEFFQERSNNIADVILEMTASYEDDPDQLMILITDLMIPSADECVKMVNAIKKSVLEPEHSTFGIIGIVGDFRGMIDNLPVNPNTGMPRKIGDYMVLERDSNGVFRHPLYMLFMGNDQAVLSAMEKAMTGLKDGGLLDDTNPLYAMYYSEYDTTRVEQEPLLVEFDIGCAEYDLANYPMKYIVQGVQDENGTIEYPAQTAIPDEYQPILKDIKVVKMYDLKRGISERNNVSIDCSVPFELIDSTQNGGKIIDKHHLVVPAKNVCFAYDDYSVTADIKVLQYEQNEGAAPRASWVAQSTLVRCGSAAPNAAGTNIHVDLTVDTKQLLLDEPFLCKVDIHLTAEPQWEELSALYHADWVNTLNMSMKQLDSEFLQTDMTKSSARFTSAITAKTPYLSSFLNSGIADQQIAIVGETIRNSTTETVQTAMFGIVVRDIPKVYLPKGEWSEEEDFGGWAFSVTDARKIQEAFR